VRRVARELMMLAKEVSEVPPQTVLRFKRSDKVDAKEYNGIHFELQRFVATVRGNEDLKTTVTRTDDDKEMVLTVGFSNHEARKAIVKELERQARKLAKKAKITLKVG
jgi:hypothetical protein